MNLAPNCTDACPSFLNSYLSTTYSAAKLALLTGRGSFGRIITPLSWMGQTCVVGHLRLSNKIVQMTLV